MTTSAGYSGDQPEQELSYLHGAQPLPTHGSSGGRRGGRLRTEAPGRRLIRSPIAGPSTQWNDVMRLDRSFEELGVNDVGWAHAAIPH